MSLGVIKEKDREALAFSFSWFIGGELAQVKTGCLLIKIRQNNSQMNYLNLTTCSYLQHNVKHKLIPDLL